MNETITVSKIREFENSGSDILLERAPGSEALLWPLARWPIAAAISASKLNVQAVSRQNSRNLRLRASRRFPNPHSSDNLSDSLEHLFIVSGTTLNKGSGRAENWLSDAYAIALGDSAAVVQDAPLHPFLSKRDRPMNRRTWSFEPAMLRVLQHTQLNAFPAEHHRALQHQLKRLLKPFENVLTDALKRRVVNEVTYRVVRLTPAEREFAQLLDRTMPRRIYMQTAAYGDRSNFIRIAHQRGIKVAELQHGWIGASHAAYNFGTAFDNADLAATLPDTLYTFGEYWGRDLSFPGRLTPVGKPELSKVQQLASPPSARPLRLLLLSSVYERDLLVRTASKLRDLLPSSWEVALRPHPSERTTAHELFAEALQSGVVLDNFSNVSDSLVHSLAVVGMVSTVLFEALPMGVHIGILETDLSNYYSPSTTFPIRIHDDLTLSAFVNRAVTAAPPSVGSFESLWHPRPVETFLNAVSN